MGSHIEIIARGLITAGPHVLLCRSVKAGYRYLPGGHVEFGEAAADALAREIREECGLESKVGDLVLITEERFHDGKRQRHELNLVFRATIAREAADARPVMSGGVFHVEHPHPTSPPPHQPGAQAGLPPGVGAGSGQSSSDRPAGAAPAAVRSLEPKIAFDWVGLAGLRAADLRPASIRSWLIGLQLDAAGELVTPSLAWRA